MIFKDAKFPQDTIEVVLREETHGDLIDIEIQDGGSASVYLTKESAKDLAEHLLELSSPEAGK